MFSAFNFENSLKFNFITSPLIETKQYQSTDVHIFYFKQTTYALMARSRNRMKTTELRKGKKKRKAEPAKATRTRVDGQNTGVHTRKDATNMKWTNNRVWRCLYLLLVSFLHWVCLSCKKFNRRGQCKCQAIQWVSGIVAFSQRMEVTCIAGHSLLRFLNWRTNARKNCVKARIALPSLPILVKNCRIFSKSGEHDLKLRKNDQNFLHNMSNFFSFFFHLKKKLFFGIVPCRGLFNAFWLTITDTFFEKQKGMKNVLHFFVKCNDSFLEKRIIFLDSTITSMIGVTL